MSFLFTFQFAKLIVPYQLSLKEFVDPFTGSKETKA